MEPFQALAIVGVVVLAVNSLRWEIKKRWVAYQPASLEEIDAAKEQASFNALTKSTLAYVASKYTDPPKARKPVSPPAGTFTVEEGTEYSGLSFTKAAPMAALLLKLGGSAEIGDLDMQRGHNAVIYTDYDPIKRVTRFRVRERG